MRDTVYFTLPKMLESAVFYLVKIESLEYPFVPRG